MVSPQQIDQRLAQQNQSGDYAAAAADAISADPVGWVKHRVTELANAYLQPTAPSFSRRQFEGTGLQLAAHGSLVEWADRADAHDAFWPKLVLYLFHYTALIGGLIGLWLTRIAGGWRCR